MNVTTLGTVLAVGMLLAQASPLAQPTAQRFFPKADLMDVGVYYYPEQWPRDQWARDLGNIKKLGFSFTHFAEFAWTYLEPEDGTFDFAWLDEAVARAHEAGLKVILCTPSPAPPAWMADEHPEILLTGADGRRREHGTRANGSLSNPRFLAYVDRIVAKLAERYGTDERIWGWQIDNEPESTPDYSASARTAFQSWLRTRYGTVERLNDAWGGSFWSLRYARFDQVGLPNPSMTGEDKLSPHALVDFQRFNADTQAAFLDRQATILRQHTRPEQWVTSNFMNATEMSDPRRPQALDFPSFTMYLVAGANFLGGQTFRYGNPYRLMEASDYFRPIAGVTGVMELQPGQINWATTNPKPEPGAVRMWVWHAFGGGSSFLCTYRYRQPRFGSEMYHEGIVGLDGVTLSQGGREFVQAMQELQSAKAAYDPATTLPPSLAARRTALLWSHDVMWDLDQQKQGEHWSTWRHRNLYSTIVKSTGAPLDFIAEGDDFSRYPFLVAPAYQLASTALIEKWTRYVEGGGHLILTPRSAQKGADGHFPEVPLGARLEALVGARLEGIDTLPLDRKGQIAMGTRSFSWRAWADLFRPQAGTTTLATYADQFYAGAAAAITRRLGKGTVTYIGVETIDAALERELVRQVYERARVPIEDLPAGVYVDWRDGFFVGVNYSALPVRLRLGPKSRMVVGTNPLAPAQVLVWKDAQ
ncbi:MAG: beta-galactosidase [Acidobacteria bacterium]|nr:beta-galactosidase [Acidobacteriota bacterium]